MSIYLTSFADGPIRLGQLKLAVRGNTSCFTPAQEANTIRGFVYLGSKSHAGERCGSHPQG